MTKTKRQQEQERLDLETAVRLQEEFDEEERQRIPVFRGPQTGKDGGRNRGRGEAEGNSHQMTKLLSTGGRKGREGKRIREKYSEDD
ncbi:hypothetical protein Tco_0907211 [Tanacetum coccineum]|uniref:Uncharacterized protein n=1 Tax=Tanacetum coccineum TaxID=301880 RepID=A0ABQ5CIM2_9ASTR